MAPRLNDNDPHQVIIKPPENQSQPQPTEILLVKLRGSDGNEIHFYIRFGTQMWKLKKAFSEEVQIPQRDLKFQFFDSEIDDFDTPHSLQMIHGDVVDVSIKDGKKYLKIKLLDETERKSRFCKVEESEPLLGCLQKFAYDKGLEFRKMIFCFNGWSFDPEKTPKDLEMKSGNDLCIKINQKTQVGSFDKSRYEEKLMKFSQKDENPDPEKSLELVIKSFDGTKITIPFKLGTSLDQLKKKYCEKAQITLDNLFFAFKHQEIKDFETPLSLGMKSQDVIEVFEEGKFNDLIKFKLVDEVNNVESVLLANKKNGLTSTLMFYCFNNGIPMYDSDFEFEGSKIDLDSSPETLGLKHNDVIVIKKNALDDSSKDENLVLGKSLNLVIKSSDGKKITIQIKLGTSFDQLKENYAREVGISLDNLVFTFRRLEIEEKETPYDLNMKNGSIIEVFDIRKLKGLIKVKFFEEVKDKTKTALMRTNFSLTSNLMAYAFKEQVLFKDLEFVFRGKKVDPSMSPKTLGMNPNEVIKITKISEKGLRSNFLFLNFKSTEKKICLHLLKDTNFAMIKKALSSQLKIPKLVLYFNGRKIQDQNTPKDLGMKNKDFIEVFEDKKKKIIIKLVNEVTKESKKVKVDPHEPLSNAWSQMDPNGKNTIWDMIFCYKGQSINPFKTPKGNGIQENGVVKIYKRYQPVASSSLL